MYVEINKEQYKYNTIKSFCKDNDIYIVVLVHLVLLALNLPYITIYRKDLMLLPLNLPYSNVGEINA